MRYRTLGYQGYSFLSALAFDDSAATSRTCLGSVGEDNKLSPRNFLRFLPTAPTLSQCSGLFERNTSPIEAYIHITSPLYGLVVLTCRLLALGRGYPRLFLPRWLLTGNEYLPYEVVNSSTPGNVS